MIAAKFYKLAVLLRRMNLDYLHDPAIRKPRIKVGQRKQDGASYAVVRVYSDEEGLNKKEFKINSPKAEIWKTILDEQTRRAKIEKQLEFRPELEHTGFLDQTSVFKKNHAYNKEVFDALVERNDPSIKKKHIFDGHIFRSKSEMMIAQIIKSLGLEYKYDVVVTFDGEVFYIDFAIYCPETGRFFFMEHFGDMGSEGYRQRTFHKITVYTTHGLIEGLDILYTYENNADAFNWNVYEGKLLSIIATHAIASMNESI